MKIIQVIPHLGSGGAERLTTDLCNKLAEFGHEVILYTLYPIEGRYAFYSNQLSSSIKLRSLNKKPGTFVNACIKMFHVVRQEKPDVIHTHLWALPYTFLPELLYRKGVHTVHSEASVESTNFLNRICRKILFYTKRVIPVSISPESNDSFIKYYHITPVLINNGRNIPSNIKVSLEVHNEIQSFKHNADTRCIVHLAHIDDVKRQMLHANVIKRLYDEGYNFTTLFIGSTQNKQYVESVIKALPPCAHILGERTNPLEYLKEAGAYALCSRYEGLPISFLEALGVGSIPICMPLGGITKILKDGQNGILAKGLEENDFYEAYKRYLDMSDNECQAMSILAQKSFAPYDMDNCAESYANLYRSIIHI